MNGRTLNGVRGLGVPVALVALLAVLTACAAPSSERGVLPEGAPRGEVVALTYDAAGGRLLRAHAHALYESPADSARWQPVPVPPSVRRGRIAAVAAVTGRADAGTTLYIAGPELGVLRSEDAGRTWITLNETLPSTNVAAIATHADDPSTLYAVVPAEGVYRSEDAGETWKRMDAGPGVAVRQLFHSDMPGSMQTGWLFAATTDGVRRSMDCFCGWRPTGESAGGGVSAVAYDPRQPEHVYAAAASGVFRSVNGGEGWERVSAEGPVKTALTMDLSGVLYAATPDGALLQSADKGRTWERFGA